MSRVIKVTEQKMSPQAIEVRGARVHNLKDIDIDIPLGKLVGIAGVSGSGKSSLALGVLYAEGSRRYLEALSTYTRRRLTQAEHAQVDEVLHVPAALALHQRPSVPGVRSTFGTMTELNNSLRLLFSRCAHHVCPHCGARVEPSLNVAAGLSLTCPACGREFYAPSAEDLAFNSGGACPTCGGTGVMREVDEASLVPDESKTINEGAVLPWGTLMWDLMKQVAGEMGVRTDVPFNQLTPEERDIVFHGPAVKKHILYVPKNGEGATPLDFTYYNAVYTVENALAKVKDDKGLKRVARFLREGACRDCGGTRLSEAARQPQVCGINLAQAAAMTLGDAVEWVRGVPASLPPEMRPMATDICDSFLSVLYVLDEPSIGLHPANVDGLVGVMRDLVDDGNTVVVVDHDTRVLAEADYLVEMGPVAGAGGGSVIAAGTVDEVEQSQGSRIAPFLRAELKRLRPQVTDDEMFDQGHIRMATDAIHTVKPLEVDIPRGRLVAVTGVSGSGKTTLVLETLIPALKAQAAGERLPGHVRWVDAEGIGRANLIDATPIGANVRSTVATYADIHDELRRAFARTPEAKAAGYKAGAFSYNTGALRCPTCDGTGSISLDVQFLPDVEIICPACRGSRYAEAASHIHREGKDGSLLTLPQLMDMSVDEALDATVGLKKVQARLQTLHDLGLGYLTLGEPTPALSGGEAQRLKLASEMGRVQDDAVFVFDEPTIGLHPLDVQVLLSVFDGLVSKGATVIVIEHDLDLIRNADYVIDMGPGGGDAGGQIVCAGTPADIAACPKSVTGRYL